MPEYTAPLRDMQFVLYEMLETDKHYATLPGCEEMTRDLMDAIVDEAAKLAQNVLLPLQQTADEEGCHFDDGAVTTPKGFPDAYKQYCEGGWPSMMSPAEFGGQQLPESMGMMTGEMFGACNWAFNMYPGLSSAAIKCIYAHGSDEQKQTYLEKLISGQWLGTMCLTEAHCGSAH